MQAHGRRGRHLPYDDHARCYRVRFHDAVHLYYRRRGLLSRQGPVGRRTRCAAAGARVPGPAAQARPLPQRRSGHDEPVPARRGLCHRRRRRDRPRPRPLRALCRGSVAAQRFGHDRPDLFDRDRARAPRRISRRHGSGHPARHRRDQGIHPGRSRRRGFRLVRDRRHRRRHREPAVSRGDSPARLRTRPRAGHVRAPDPGAVYPVGGRTEDQADPAFDQGTARTRHSARHPAYAGATARSRSRRGARSRCSATCAKAGSSRRSTSTRSTAYPPPIMPRASTAKSARISGSRRRNPISSAGTKSSS